MFFNPLRYNEPLFRPPAEAYSAILQVTLGCSWNSCAFCEMYTSKTFRARLFEDIKNDIRQLAGYYQGVKKVFLADGNAFVLSANRLIPILKEINSSFGRLQRISSYALPGDILSKSPSELEEIRSLGLKLLYIGIESGDDELLHLINKGETYASTKEAILKAHEAGIETSVMILNGLGGRKYSEQHALNSAQLINEIRPKLLSTLTLSLPFGQKHFEQKFRGEYIPQTIVELATELKLFLQHTSLTNTIFRSDHVSNSLALKGILSKDKEMLLQLIENTIETTNPDIYPVSPGLL